MSRRIIIDASHGGSDSGLSANGIVEKDISLKLSNYIYDKLKNLGYDVNVVRNNDVTISDQDRVNRILDIYGDSSDVILLSNNFNSDSNQAEIIYALRNTSGLPNLIYDELVKTGLEVKEPFQLRLPSNTSLDYYYIHRNTGNIQPIVIQYGSLSDKGFSSNILNNYISYGDAVVDAISSYLGSSSNEYIVKSGDTLYSIARKFNTSVDKLKSLNNLSNNFLNVGQVLIIDGNGNSNNSNNSTYIVKSGDTLYSIARKYNTNVNELLKLNNLVSSSLSIGQVLKIPSSNQSSFNYINYTVKKGDNLYSLSNRYGVSVMDIMSFNNLTSNLLSIGQVLKIPVSSNEYIVKSGDTLYSIARKFNTTVDNIKKINNLSSSSLSIGQKLLI